MRHGEVDMSAQVSGAMAVSLTMAIAVQGQPIIQYTLELGGDNQAELWKSGEFPPPPVPPFLQGRDADGQIFDPSMVSTITWDVVVEVLDDDSNGLAALSFSLELYEEDGMTPVSVMTYTSTINDGRPGMLPQPDPLERAAFCHIYDVNGDGLNPPYVPSPIPGGTYNRWPDHLGSGPGRLFDTIANGGPDLGHAWFPDTADHVGGEWTDGVYTAGSGSSGVPPHVLAGMGCSYTQFVPGSQVAGVGMNVDYGPPPYSCVRGLGVLPLFEGQIDISMLRCIHILRLVPGEHHAVLRGDFDCTDGAYPIEDFAVPVSPEQVIGDEIRFVVVGCPDPEARKWASLRDHDPRPGVVDLREIVLDPDASGSAVVSETRRNGPASPGDGLSGIKMIRVDFRHDVSSRYTPGVVAEDLTRPGQYYAATNEYLVDGGTALIIEFMDSPDIETANSTLPRDGCYRIDLNENFWFVWNGVCMVRSLTGDVAGNASGFGNGTTNTTDAVAIRNAFLNGVVPTGENVRFDINANGQINQTDASFVRDIAFNGGLGASCPN
jgi:hypothetical protein